MIDATHPHGARLFRRTCFLLIATLALLGCIEWEHYRKTVGWNAFELSVTDKVIIGWSLWAKSLSLFLPVLIGAEALARLGWRHSGQAIWLLGANLVTFWLLADLKVQATTGNHLSVYWQFLFDRESWKYGGGIAYAARRGALGLSALALLLAGLDWVCGKHSGWLSRRWSWLNSGAGVLATLAVLFAATLGAAAAQRLISCPLALERLCATLPCNPLGWSLAPAGQGELDQFRLEVSERIAPAFERVHARMLRPAPPDRQTWSMPRKPHIVLFVLESLRHDALALMPRVQAWSAKGLRLEQHYAGTNCSHEGVFGLLEARHPLVYYPTLDARIEPQSCATLHAAGYECSFLTSGPTHWQRMDDYLNKRNFERVEQYTDDWITDDCLLVRRIQSLLRSDQPQFIVAFFMCTHCPYGYPREFEKHVPVIPMDQALVAKPSQRALLWNRYANSAAFLDHEIGELLAGLDPLKTWAVVTGDHGESFFEDGTLFHSSKLSEIQTRVPLAMVGEGIPSETIQAPTTHWDVFPTLLHCLTGTAVDLQHVHGRDLLAGPLADHVLLGAVSPDRFGQAMLVRGKERLGFTMTAQPKELRVVGFFDEACRFDPTHHPTAEMAGEWSAIAAEQFERLGR